jgi:3-dehydroquinate synthase
MTESSSIKVQAERDYEVSIGRGLLTTLTHEDWVTSGPSYVVVHNRDVSQIAQSVIAQLHNAGGRVLAIEIPSGEQAKTIEVVDAIWQQLASNMVDRSGVIVAVGGGATTDVAGFAAATWMRGVDVINIPTTSAGMVDAAIGGKTGINTGAGKNLVGAFHSPRAVYCDLDSLASLPVVEHVAGLAEAIKCGFIADPLLLAIFEEHGAALEDARHPVMHEVIERAVKVKAEVVSADFRECSDAIGRELLNYGHTFGHALEALSGYTMRHGDAVAIGMVFAAELSEILGEADAAFVARHRNVLTSIGLPTTHGYSDVAAAFDIMGRDKKSRAGVVRFILLSAVGQAYVATDVPLVAVTEAFNRTR